MTPFLLELADEMVPVDGTMPDGGATVNPLVMLAELVGDATPVPGHRPYTPAWPEGYGDESGRPTLLQSPTPPW